MNALKHGGFATAPVAIPRGAFAEDPDELDEFINDIVDALDPRDALESEQARRIAMCCVRSRRLNHYEAEALGRPQPPNLDDSQDGDSLEEHLADARALRQWFVTRTDTGVDFEPVLLFMMTFHQFFEGHDGFEPEPETNLTRPAQERVEWFLEHSCDRAELAGWVIEEVERYETKIGERDAAQSARARAALSDTDKVSVTSQRNSRELDQALRQYTLLRNRPLPPASDATRNEPTDQ